MYIMMFSTENILVPRFLEILNLGAHLFVGIGFIHSNDVDKCVLCLRCEFMDASPTNAILFCHFQIPLNRSLESVVTGYVWIGTPVLV